MSRSIEALSGCKLGTGSAFSSQQELMQVKHR